MAMYFMNGKTFLKQYINEDPDKVLKTQFVIVSSTIRKGSKYDTQIINGNNLLFPSQNLIMDYDDYKHNENYKTEYYTQLDEAKPLLATLIKGTIDEGYTIVFICGEREKKYAYLSILQEYVDEKFNFHIYDYKKYKNRKEKIVKYNEDAVLSICDKILKKAKKKSKRQALKTDTGRKKYISSMSKSEMKKELKSRYLYTDDMDKQDMIETLMIFM